MNDRVKACIIPISAKDAIAWSKGLLRDRDIFLRARLVPEAIFIANLPDRRAYVDALRAVSHWAERGAVCLVARTSHRDVRRHLLKNGAVEGWSDCPGERRYLAGPAAFAKWINKFHPRT